MEHTRNFGAAILGYVAMFVVFLPLGGLTWFVLGADGAFQPGTWAVSPAWIAASIVFGFCVSMAGGFTAAKVGADKRAVVILAVLVIVVGVLQAMPEEAARATTRPEAVTLMQALSSLQQPTWLLVLNPLLGAVGVLVGGKLEGGSAA